jgi:hypothetical protein
MDQLFPQFNDALSRCRQRPHRRRTPLEPIRSLFPPYGGSVAGMRWAAKAARKATPRKQRAAVRAEQATIIRRLCDNPLNSEPAAADVTMNVKSRLP